MVGGTACTRVVRRPGAALTCSKCLVNEKAPKLLQGLPSQSFKRRESFLLVRHHISEDILLNTALKYQYMPTEAAKIKENETPSVDRGLKNRMLGANWWNCRDAVLRISVRQNQLLPSEPSVWPLSDSLPFGCGWEQKLKAVGFDLILLEWGKQMA